MNYPGTAQFLSSQRTYRTMRILKSIAALLLLSLLPLSSYAAPPTVGQHTVFNEGFGTSFTSGNLSTAATGSDFVVLVFYGSGGSNTVTSVTDSKGNTYLPKTLSPASTGGFAGVLGAVYVVENGAGGTGHNFTVNTSSANTVAAFAIEIVGALTSSGVDQLVGGGISSSTTTIAAPAATTTHVNELVISAYGSSGANTGAVTITNSGTFTFLDKNVLGSGQLTGATSFLSAPAIGTYGDTYTQSIADANGYATMTISFIGAPNPTNGVVMSNGHPIMSNGHVLYQ
jgi:hypothetical protein